MKNELTSYQHVLEYLYSFIPDRLALKFAGENGIKRIKYLLKLLDNPQEKIQVIHIAGTSGKGSTAFITSYLLTDLGFKTGLQISPHLLDLRERFQINNQLISKEKFTQTFQEILPIIKKAKNTAWGKITYFEIIVAFSFYLFYKENVDYAIVETGLGGLFDGTNIVENPNKISVITKIGLDHQWILGRTLTEIARQKTGIIKSGNTVITLKQKNIVNKTIKNKAKKESAKLYFIQKGINFKKIHVEQSVFDFTFDKFSLDKLQLNIFGYHQFENASLALTAVYLLGQRYNFRINENKIRETFKKISFPGRFEIFKTKYKEIIIDGAHNPQKMKAFITSLIKFYPNNKFDFLISFSRSKDQIMTLRNMLRLIIPYANHIFITSFTLEGQDSFHQSVDLDKIASILKSLNYFKFKIIKRNDKLLNNLVIMDNKPLVITGSLYFLSSLYQNIKKLK